MTFTVVVDANQTKYTLDEHFDEITSKYSRFYGSDAKNYKYCIAVETLPGGFSCYFLGFDSKRKMVEAMYFILKCARGSEVANYNKKHCTLERLVAAHDESKRGVSVNLLDDVADWPRVYFGTSEQFEDARQNRVF